ncbi:TPA: DoxX family protein, partial [Escherichia coli]
MGNYTSALLLLARLMLACLYMISGVPKLLSFTGTIDKMASLGLIFPAITAAIVVLVEIVGALMIVFGFFTRPVSIILCLYTVLASFLGHAFWTMPAELAHGNMIHFYKNICISGGFL